MSVDLAFNTTELTLKFLANKVYQEVMEQKIAVDRPNNEDYLFYNKRLIDMFADMIDGKFPNDDIKKEHMYYVDTLIEYMKLHDRSDILQADHIKRVSFSKYEDSKFDISGADMCMLNVCETKQPTLDDFVITKKVIIKETIHPPIIRVVDIKTESHKTKGIKQKTI